jgi:hypothetical protein
MSMIKNTFHKPATRSLLLLVALTMGPTLAFSSGQKSETIDATAGGTSTQLGQMVGITLDIYDYSTPADTQILDQAFEKAGEHGLVNALSKMKAVGRISITGTLGYDVSYIHEVVTPTGRKITFVTNRLIRFGEAYFDTRSESYNLTVGELSLNDMDKSKSTGFLYPECKLQVDKQGQLQYDLVGNPFTLINVLDWKGTPGLN